MFEAFKKYAVFSGRARRKEYWLFYVGCLLAALVGGFIDGFFVFVSDMGLGLFGGLVTLGVIIPSVAVGVRRLHDTGRSGWWLLISIIPIVGWIVLIIFWCLDGTKGANRFGEDPKNRENEIETFFVELPSENITNDSVRLSEHQEHFIFRGLDPKGEPISFEMKHDQVLLGRGYVIGRSLADADMLIDHDLISREHLRITFKGDGLYASDLDSTNGTELNGVRMPPFVELIVNFGDVLSLAGVALTLTN